VAAHAAPDGAGRMRLHGRVVSLGGERGVEGIQTAPATDEYQADALGIVLAERLISEGAGEILAEVRAAAAPLVPEP
jgi:porphobilinogen deaminase